MSGRSVFYQDEAGQIFHTYSSFARGGELFLGSYAFLDITPKGRDETINGNLTDWVRHHDRYEDSDERPAATISWTDLHHRSRGLGRGRTMKLFYGWVIVGVGIVVSCVGMGTMMSLGVFLQPMSQAMGWSRAGISLRPPSLNFLCMGAGALFWGSLSDRFGTRTVVLIGGGSARRRRDRCEPKRRPCCSSNCCSALLSDWRSAASMRR